MPENAYYKAMVSITFPEWHHPTVNHLFNQFLFLFLYIENLAMVCDHHDPRKQLQTYLCLDRVFSNELVDMYCLCLTNPTGQPP
jgi:hypothetical protein